MYGNKQVGLRIIGDDNPFRQVEGSVCRSSKSDLILRDENVSSSDGYGESKSSFNLATATCPRVPSPVSGI